MLTSNNTPYQVETILDKDIDLNPMLVVVIKATYDFNPSGHVQLSTKQVPITYGDEMTEAKPVASVRFESDLAPFKPKGDFVVVGHAMTQNRSVTMMDVGFRFGSMEKVVKVLGDRVWHSQGMLAGITPSNPEPFEEMELTFDRSFGGIDMNHGEVCTANPSGKGIFHKKSKKEEILGQPLPNVEDPSHLIKTWKDKPNPIGMGYIAKGWSQRIGLMGTYDDEWKENRNPDRPVDFDFNYYNAAPVDQQVDGYFKGDEVIELLNMTPGQDQVQFQLPNIHPRAFVEKIDGSGLESIVLNLDTVCVISKTLQFTLVWRGWTAVEDPLMQGVKSLMIEPHKSM